MSLLKLMMQRTAVRATPNDPVKDVSLREIVVEKLSDTETTLKFGHLDPIEIDELQDRFNDIHLNPPVEPYLYPKDGDWRFTQNVPPSAVAKVNAIRDQALSFGWSEARLYQNQGRYRFPCGQDYGLVCFVDENVRIGEVTRQYIEIIGLPPSESLLHFYNIDVAQPWMRRTHGER